MYAKTVIRHLKNGGKLRDLDNYEPGRCSNGGHYWIVWRIMDGVLMTSSSYEDAEWEPEQMSLRELAEWASKNWHDRPSFIDGDRFELA